MKKSGGKAKNLFRNIRLKLKPHSNHKQVHVLSFLITYALTIGLSVVSILIELDSKNILLTSDMLVNFHNCQSISVLSYLFARLVEVLIPTTITFCSTILILEVDFQTQKHLGTWIFISIALLVAVGVAMPLFSNQEYLEIFVYIGLALTILPILLINRVYHFDCSQSNHKQELCDGHISGIK